MLRIITPLLTTVAIASRITVAAPLPVALADGGEWADAPADHYQDAAKWGWGKNDWNNGYDNKEEWKDSHKDNRWKADKEDKQKAWDNDDWDDDEGKDWEMEKWPKMDQKKYDDWKEQNPEYYSDDWPMKETPAVELPPSEYTEDHPLKYEDENAHHNYSKGGDDWKYDADREDEDDAKDHEDYEEWPNHDKLVDQPEPVRESEPCEAPKGWQPGNPEPEGYWQLEGQWYKYKDAPVYTPDPDPKPFLPPGTELLPCDSPEGWSEGDKVPEGYLFTHHQWYKYVVSIKITTTTTIATGNDMHDHPTDDAEYQHHDHYTDDQEYQYYDEEGTQKEGKENNKGGDSKQIEDKDKKQQLDATHRPQIVYVAPEGYKGYVPFALNVTVGSTVEFLWKSGPHEVARSSTDDLCGKIKGDKFFSSGPQPSGFKLNKSINDTQPVWYYDAVEQNCAQDGVFGTLNPSNAYGKQTSIGSKMKEWTDKHPELKQRWEFVQSLARGNVQLQPFLHYGDGIDLEKFDDKLHYHMAEHVIETRFWLVQNGGLPEQRKDGSFKRKDGKEVEFPKLEEAMVAAGIQQLPVDAAAQQPPSAETSKPKDEKSAAVLHGSRFTSTYSALTIFVSSLFWIAL